MLQLLRWYGQGCCTHNSHAVEHNWKCLQRPVGIPEAIAESLNSSVVPLAEDSPSAAAQAAALDLLRVVTRGSRYVLLGALVPIHALLLLQAVCFTCCIHPRHSCRGGCVAPIDIVCCSNLYLKYEENNALLSRVASCALVATKNSDRSVRTEGFRVLSVMMHKYHLFSEKYLPQLFGAVADELERHEHVRPT
jgi:hypothetical protein